MVICSYSLVIQCIRYIQKIQNREGLLSQIGGAKAAAQTVFSFAVVLSQLNQGLAVGSVFNRNAGTLPTARDVVPLRGYLLQDAKSALRKVFVHEVTPIGKKQGGNGVDEQQVQRGLPKGFLDTPTLHAESVVRAPVVGDANAEEATEVFVAPGFKQHGKVHLVLTVETGELGKTHIGKVLRTKPPKAPQR